MKTKDRPLLFNSLMVKALITGMKTQTRRVANGLGGKLGDEFSTEISSGEIVDTSSLCPHGRVGDRLWVKETFKLWDYSLTQLCAEYRAGGEDKIYQLKLHEEKPKNLHARKLDGERFWRPSIFMPRWASRITLEITGVRVERLQEISEADAMAEGVDWKDYAGLASKTAKKLYAQLWDSINGKKHPWKSNPWVWVVTFKKI